MIKYLYTICLQKQFLGSVNQVQSNKSARSLVPGINKLSQHSQPLSQHSQPLSQMTRHYQNENKQTVLIPYQIINWVNLKTKPIKCFLSNAIIKTKEDREINSENCLRSKLRRIWKFKSKFNTSLWGVFLFETKHPFIKAVCISISSPSN